MGNASGCTALAFVLLIAFAPTAQGSLPPAFPWQGGEVTLHLAPASGALAEGQAVAIEFWEDGGRVSTLALVGGNSTVKAFLARPGPLTLLVSFDDPQTPGADLVSAFQPASTGSGQGTAVTLVPAGTASMATALDGSAPFACTIIASCSGAPGAEFEFESGPSGELSVPLPAGECNATAFCANKSATASFMVSQGEVSRVVFSPAQPFGQGISQAAAAVLVVALAAFAVLAITLLYMMRPEGKARKKGKPPSPRAGRQQARRFAQARKKAEAVKAKGARFARKSKKFPRARMRLFLAAPLLALLLLGAAHAATLSFPEPAFSHVFDLQGERSAAPILRDAVISGSARMPSGEPCNGTVSVRVSGDNASSVQVGSFEMVSGGSFALRFISPGAHRYYGVSSRECLVYGVSFNYSELPRLRIRSIEINYTEAPGEVRAGVPAQVRVEVVNDGGAFSSQDGYVSIRFTDRGYGEPLELGEALINASDPIWAGSGSAVKSITWIPQSSGSRTVYASLNASPEAAQDVAMVGGSASAGVLVRPGRFERRATRLSVSVTPEPLHLSSLPPAIMLDAVLFDELTGEPVAGAACTGRAQAFSGPEFGLMEEEAHYVAALNPAGIKVGAYPFSVSCGKEGYATASASGVIVVNTAKGERVVLSADRLPGMASGAFSARKSALGYPERMRVIIERASLEEISVSPESVTVNGFHASGFAFNGSRENESVLLDGSTAEWVFALAEIPGDALEISVNARATDSPSGGGVPAISARVLPLLGLCARKSPELLVYPASQSGELGSALNYQALLMNRDSPECGPSSFKLSVAGARRGWTYSLPGLSPETNPGETSSFYVSVTPPDGESPGDFKFKIDASGETGLAASAEARFAVTTENMRSRLNSGVKGPSPLVFSARFTDATGGQIGSCSLGSRLVGGQSVQMLPKGSLLEFEVQTGSIPPGLYPYTITCAAEGYNTKSASGSVSVASEITSKPPGIKISPASQSPSSGTPLSFAVKITPSSCSDAPIMLRANPPEGFNAALDRDTAEGCGATYATLTITPVRMSLQEPAWGSVSAFAQGAPEAKARFVLQPGGQVPVTLTCASGDALESAQNEEVSGDPCWNWNSAHTYNFTWQSNGSVVVSGKTFLPGCGLPVVVELWNGSSLIKGQEANSGPSGSFSASLPGGGFSSLRVASPCLIEASEASASASDNASMPNLQVASAQFSARMQEGVPETVSLIIRNTGAAAKTRFRVLAKARNASGPVELGSGLARPLEGGSGERVDISFMPPPPGEYTLVFSTDPERAVNESELSDNLLSVGEIIVASTGGRLSFGMQLEKGWNLLPFAEGAELSHSCSAVAASAFDPSAPSGYRELDPATLYFSSTADAGEFIAANGRASRPKTAAAFGAAWMFADAGCSANFTSPLPGKGWRTLRAGQNLVTILPSDEGNTISNLARDCKLVQAAGWDAGAQEWERVRESTIIGPSRVGTVVALETAGACRLD